MFIPVEKVWYIKFLYHGVCNWFSVTGNWINQTWKQRCYGPPWGTGSNWGQDCGALSRLLVFVVARFQPLYHPFKRRIWPMSGCRGTLRKGDRETWTWCVAGIAMEVFTHIYLSKAHFLKKSVVLSKPWTNTYACNFVFLCCIAYIAKKM